ncbi:MAG: hypothetical protein ACHQQS_01445 [Thermoanaerobaculales bacterium]
MHNETDFVIDQVGWGFVGSLESRVDQKRRFCALVMFLQSNGLTSRTLLAQGEEVPDGFSLCKSDLTPEGFGLIQLAYQKWLAALDRRRRKDPENLGILVTALAKLRSEVQS